MDKLSARALCFLLGFPMDPCDFTFYHPPLHGFLNSRVGVMGAGAASCGSVGVEGAGTRCASSEGIGVGGTSTGGASSGGARAGGPGTGGARSGGAGVGGGGTGGARFGGAGDGGVSYEKTEAGGTATMAPTPPPHHYGTRFHTLR
ncbi:unnamed protein product [Closterium sp. NIES-53]